MLIHSAKLARFTLTLIWVVAAIALVVLVTAGHVLPAFGRELYVVRGGSMQPAIPIGSAVIVERVDAAALTVGDVVTFRGSSGSVITHRVVTAMEHAEDPIKTKGDASDAADPFVVPADTVIGRVQYIVPVAGVVLLNLGSTVGMVATLAMIGGLVLAIWFMDELIANLSRPSARRASAAAPVR